MTDDSTALQDLLTQLETGAPAQRRAAVLKLGMMHNPLIVPDLIRAADDADTGVRSLIASALASLGGTALDRVRAALSHDNPRVRQTMLNALRHMDNPATVPDIIPLLTDPHAAVQDAAADALRAYDTPQARAALKQH